MENIFGTDGIRDRAGEGFLSEASLNRIGLALSRFVLSGRRDSARVLFGRDTRVSGPAIENVIGRALRHAGCEVVSAGVVPTPAVSLLVPEEGFSLGIVISASHNPPQFNGIKVFDRWGRKLTLPQESEITAAYHATDLKASVPTGEGVPYDPQLRERYLQILATCIPQGELSGLRIALDCARGATATVAKEAFTHAGAEVRMIYDDLDGERINHGCGSLHPEDLRRLVKEWGADLGFAFDGDGDRVIAIDDTGAEVDGDDVLALWAISLKDRGHLLRDRVVATVMSNAGMERFLSDRSVEVLRAPVGDREVFAMLQDEGAVLGGEQSGHIIFSQESASGDGIRTGLHLARIVCEAGCKLSELRAPIPRFPQVLLAVEVDEKIPLSELPGLMDEQKRAEAALGARGRVFLRYSGTEPVARVLVEGEDPAENQKWADRLRDTLLTEIRSVSS